MSRSHTHFQADDSDDDAEPMEDSPPDFSSQGFMNETAPPPGEATAGGVELGGANLVTQPRKVCTIDAIYVLLGGTSLSGLSMHSQDIQYKKPPY